MRVVLELQSGPAKGRKTWLITGGVIRIGRTHRADFVIPDDEQLSGVHFALEAGAGTCSIRDLHSANGTYINDRRVAKEMLRDGDEIRAGTSTFRVQIEGGPRAHGGEPVEESTTAAVAAAGSSGQPVSAPGHHIVLPGQSPEGEHILGILVKRTYDIVAGARCVRAQKDCKLIPGDKHFDDPMNTAVEFETDFFPFKLATDVVVNGSACTPGAQPAQSLTASVVVGPYRKDVRVFGDRAARFQSGKDPQFSDPTPFEVMPLRFERAYGGVDIYSDPDVPYPYARNHLGRGFVVANRKEAVDERALPNIEDPRDLLTPERFCVEDYAQWERQPMPAGIGWFSKYWQPRASLAGVMPADRASEEEFRAMYAPAVPQHQREAYKNAKLPEMDFRFFNGASPGLAVPFLAGNESVRLINLSPEGEIAFELPGQRPQIGIDIGSGAQQPEVVLHTVMIRVEQMQVDLVWRAAAPYPGRDWLPEMKKMEVTIQ